MCCHVPCDIWGHYEHWNTAVSAVGGHIKEEILTYWSIWLESVKWTMSHHRFYVFLSSSCNSNKIKLFSLSMLFVSRQTLLQDFYWKKLLFESCNAFLFSCRSELDFKHLTLMHYGVLELWFKSIKTTFI